MDESDCDNNLTAALVIKAYGLGAFPMARDGVGPIEWFSPDPRGIMPLEPGRFHVPRSLKRIIRRGQFVITRNMVFDRVIAGCAERRPERPGAWINRQIIDVYCQLHQAGLAHSVEAWQCDEGCPREQADDPGQLVGGIYGVALGGGFFAESMFSAMTDASKVCLVHLIEHLRAQHFVLMDVQYSNAHIEQFGVVEIRRAQYLRLLGEAIRREVCW